MSDVRTGGATAASIPIIGEFDTPAEMMIRLNQQREASERDAMRDEHEAAAALDEVRLGRMDEAANLRLVSSAISGGMTIASATAGGIGATGADGSAVADWGEALKGGLEGLGRAGAGIPDFYAARSDIHSSQASTGADEARSRADEARSQAEAAAASRNNIAESLEAILEAEHGSAMAASRA